MVIKYKKSDRIHYFIILNKSLIKIVNYTPTIKIIRQLFKIKQEKFNEKNL